MDEERILGGLWPATHSAVCLKSPLRRRLNRLGNGVELERPAQRHFDLQQVETQPPRRAGQLLVKIMYLSLDGVCLEQRAQRRKKKSSAGSSNSSGAVPEPGPSQAAAGDAETLLTKVGGVVRGLGVGMVVAVGGQQQQQQQQPQQQQPQQEQQAADDGGLPAPVQRTAGPFGVGQIVGGEFGWREYALVSQDAVVVAPEDMALPTVLSTLQAAHNTVTAVIGAGLLPPTATDRAACARQLQDLFNSWVESGRLSYSDARHARKLTTTSLKGAPSVFSQLWTPALSGLVSTTGTGRRKEKYVPVLSDPSAASAEPVGAAPALVAWVSGSANRSAAWVKIAQGPSVPMRAKL